MDRVWGSLMTDGATRTGPVLVNQPYFSGHNNQSIFATPTYGTTSIQPFGKRPLSGGHLQGTCGNIIGRGIPQDVVKCLIFTDVPPCLANDDAQLGFVVTSLVLRTLGDVDSGGIRPSQRGARLGEENGSLGEGEIGFLITNSQTAMRNADNQERNKD